ncbi:hypothetical protein MtrunA17_Chr7g0258581 [Medicago truncatula]|uniref:Transmembrane protein, putative n=1 Tax=Medicago truncatula TaxID=3880 RepID=G7KVC3_MEDTR|nr:transmembrane protein, putative [Medicago truncatula]RHN47957.1 hypothetical protein MtrunA17_Chr7g0258581 [Medicago truncatula]
MKITSCRVFAVILTLILIHFLLFSCCCVHHEPMFSRKTRLTMSRELLSSSFASFATSGINGKISGSKKQNRKVVEPSMRIAPPSIPNPTQNK